MTDNRFDLLGKEQEQHAAGGIAAIVLVVIALCVYAAYEYSKAPAPLAASAIAAKEWAASAMAKQHQKAQQAIAADKQEAADMNASLPYTYHKRSRTTYAIKCTDKWSANMHSYEAVCDSEITYK